MYKGVNNQSNKTLLLKAISMGTTANKKILIALKSISQNSLYFDSGAINGTFKNKLFNHYISSKFFTILLSCFCNFYNDDNFVTENE